MNINKLRKPMNILALKKRMNINTLSDSERSRMQDTFVPFHEGGRKTFYDVLLRTGEIINACWYRSGSFYSLWEDASFSAREVTGVRITSDEDLLLLWWKKGGACKKDD